MVVAVTFRRTILWGSVAWLAAISGLHAWLNLEVFKPRRASSSVLRVGYLPVT